MVEPTPLWLAALLAREGRIVASREPRAVRARAIEHLRACGASWGAIAQATGLHPSSIRSVLRLDRSRARWRGSGAIALAARDARARVRAMAAHARENKVGTRASSMVQDSTCLPPNSS